MISEVPIKKRIVSLLIARPTSRTVSVKPEAAMPTLKSS